MSNDTAIYKTKNLTIRYLIALSLVALLFILAYALIQITLYKQASDSLVINLSGRQRMLSQKLTKEVLLLAQSQTPELREKHRELLRGTLANWTRVHIGLQYGNEEFELPGKNSPQVQNLFAEVEPYYRIIKSSVDKILALGSIEFERQSIYTPLIQDIVDASPLYLQRMDRTVFQYDKEANNRVDLLKRFETYILIFVLLILSLEALLIFRPMVNKVQKSYWGFEKSNTQLKQEASERERAEKALQKAHNNLEKRVKERTAELRKANEDLRLEISERKQAEQTLKKAEQRYRELVEELDAIVWEADAQTCQITFVNKRAEEILGYPVNQWLNEANFWANHIHADDRDEAVSFCQLATQEGRDHQLEYRMIAADGSIVWLRDAVTVESVKGKPVRVKGIKVDITALKQAEEEKEKIQAQLRQAQKMETIGTLAGGIAHDFNNILAPILGYTDMALDDIPPGNNARIDLEHVTKAANRAKDLVQQILLFSRQGEQERKPVQIHLIIREALKLLQASLPSTIEIRQNIDTKSGTVLADPTQIHQVLMNLCTNAYHAIGESGGMLELSLGKIEADEAFARQHPKLHEGTYVRLTVSDTGHGMDSKTLERIFEPFFTTKGIKEGTGLGLSVVHGIVASHGGEITVYSEPEKGSTFHVYLPRVDLDVEQELSRDEPIPRGKERVLLVEDEEEIAVMTKEMLQRLGYKVTMRTSSVEALEAFRANPDKFDIVFTDQTMPNKTGVELAKELMKIRPDVPIILMTGFSEGITSEIAKKMGIREYIMKPIVTRELGKIVRQVLDKGVG